jgi:4-amino-4-deoxy-L-arabinose transferase-like glycosyltransferase
MVQALLILALCGAGALGLRAWLTRLDLDPAEAFGVAGLALLGAVGWLMFPLGLAGGVDLGIWLLAAAALAPGLIAWRKRRLAAGPLRLPRGPWLAAPLALAVLSLVPFIGMLAPADAVEWDSLAYHLAVPTLWLTADPMRPLPFIHHSFFPFGIDNLFVIGLSIGDDPAAKAFSFALYVFGLFAVFGIGRRWFSAVAGWWAAIAFAGSPLVLWLSGTAYVDVGHGLFAALGAVYAADWLVRKNRSLLLLAGLMLGFAAASKYTGLQALLVTCVVLGLALLFSRRSVRDALGAPAALAAIALVVACPWYVRNLAVTGNPVYPFFFGGKYWSEWRAEVYRYEQLTFGVGRTEAGRDVTQLPHAVLGLAYQPGRYINPNPAAGTGFPIGAVGGALIAAGLVVLAVRPRAPNSGILLGVVALTLVLWFFLSQQSRYILMVAPLLALLAGWGATWLRAGPVLAGAIALQGAYTFWLLRASLMDAQLPVALGRVSREDWLLARVPFAEAAMEINALPAGSQVALFDEVFGYLLDVPYIWANPAHSNLVNVPADGDPARFVQDLAALGCTHVYWSWVFMSPEERERTAREMAPGAPEPPPAHGAGRGAAFHADGWRPMLVGAAARGLLRPVGRWRSGALFEIVR